MDPFRRLTRIAVAASAGLATACAGIAVPPLSPPVPAGWRHAAPQEQASPVDLRGWWHAFNDAALDSLVEAALRDNLQAAEARERLLASRERARVAGAAYLPHLRAKAEDAIDPDASASFFVTGFDATWESGLFGRRAATTRQARGDADASAASLQQVHVSLAGEVVRNWLELRAAQQRAATLERVIELRQRQLDQTRIRARLKLATTQAVAQAESERAQAGAELSEPQSEIDRLAQGLAVLLGRNEPDPSWLAPAPIPSLGTLRIEQAPADLLRTRPEIARAEAEVLRAAGDAGVARANLLPRLGIGGSLVWSTSLSSHRLTRSNALSSVGPVIDLPLFDWGARRAELRARQHELQASVYAYRQAVLQGVTEVETGLGQLERQRERQAASERAFESLANAERAAATRVRLRLASPGDQIESQLALAQASLAMADATTARGLAFVSLYKALGGAPLPEAAMTAAGATH
ncbi:MAG: TolC family protein [Gammaproteobacteria bacterium]|nr:TolC family protein [Gammaproteobacteria bacterium]